MKVDHEALESILLELVADESNARECGDNTHANYLAELISGIRDCFTQK